MVAMLKLSKTEQLSDTHRLMLSFLQKVLSIMSWQIQIAAAMLLSSSEVHN